MINSSLVLNRIHLLIRQFGHLKHMNTILLEDGAHWLVAHDVPLVAWILQVVTLDVLP